jgi:hypothetical protein
LDLEISQLLVNSLKNELWLLIAIVITIFYFYVLHKMIDKISLKKNIEGNGPLFYLGQAYLSFMWPGPLYITLRIIDFL